MNRQSYVALNIKAVNEDAREIEGWATLAEMDRVGDIVLPRGAVYNLPIPFLLDHDTRQAVGDVYRVEVTDKGIKFWARIKKIAEPGEVKDLCDKAWTLVKNGLRKCVSIGFSALDFDVLPTGGLKFTSWEWLELSAVTVPAAPGARITNVKDINQGDRLSTASPPDSPPSLDTVARAASGPGRLGVVRLTPPASGLPNPPKNEGKQMKLSEKISRFEQKRAANSARIGAIHEETDESLTDEQIDEVKTLEAEIATIDRDLPSLKRAEASLAATAKNVRTVDTDPTVSLTPTPGVTVKAVPKPEPGIRFARYARCMGLAHHMKSDALRIADQLYRDRDPDVVQMVKAAGTAIGALNTTTDSALIGNEGGFADFVEFLRARTIIGRFGTDGIPALRGIPFRVPLITQATGGTAYWVGEGDGKPLTKPSFTRTELAPLKVAAISVATMETLRDSSPSAERLLRDDLAAAVIARLDTSFADPAYQANSGVNPASITYGTETVVSTGDDAEAIQLDVRSLMQHFITSKNPLTSGVWLMSSTNALALAMMKNALGQAEFPAMSINGGTFMGLPVIVSDYITTYVALVNASDVYLADDGGVSVDMSTEASLQMVAGDDEGSTLTSITPTAASLVSMFQTNSVAFRAERTINWVKRRSSAVAYLTSVDWGGAVVPS